MKWILIFPPLHFYLNSYFFFPSDFFHFFCYSPFSTWLSSLRVLARFLPLSRFTPEPIILLHFFVILKLLIFKKGGGWVVKIKKSNRRKCMHLCIKFFRREKVNNAEIGSSGGEKSHKKRATRCFVWVVPLKVYLFTFLRLRIYL